MNKKPLHITNGKNLSSHLDEIGLEGSVLTWQEMLCEGPTTELVCSDTFLQLRNTFFNEYYDMELNVSEIKKELKKLDKLRAYSEIILWFDYDLFCHINLIAIISLIQQKKSHLPLHLVCSGRIKGCKNLKALAELTSEELLQHYNNKVLLDDEAINTAVSVWRIYCGNNHNLLKPYIRKPSVFAYLSTCLKAHLERFPSLKDGLNIMEKNILKIIHECTITSKNHLLGYALNYQGFYGYNDLQLVRLINNLSLFYDTDSTPFVLNREGHEALLGQRHFLTDLKETMAFGGIKKRNYLFCKTNNKLIKSI